VAADGKKARRGPLAPRSLVAASVIATGVLACGGERVPTDDTASRAANPASSPASPTQRPAEEEPKQWTLREVARRLTDGGLVVTDSGRTSVRHSFLSVEGRLLRVSGSDLQVFVYPDAAARRMDSDRIDATRVAPADMIIDWVAPAHLIASGNLVAIHLTANERLAERVRLILEAWHTS
jgi:hypothetical protein